MAFYPQVQEDQILLAKIVYENMLKDPGYLDKSPYPNSVKEFFIKIRPPEVEDLFMDQDEIMVIEEQIQSIINDMNSMSSLIKEPTDRLNYAKTKTMLFEKLIGMRERVVNLKEINEFRNVVLQFMDEECTKDQITGLMKKLDGIMGQ